MTKNPEARLLGLQPQLPLLDVESNEDALTPVAGRVPVDEDRDWRLDEHTREVGRRGIAAARAHLRTSTGRAA